jgi:hypothetical protein
MARDGADSETSSGYNTDKLIISLSFNRCRSGVRRRTNRALARAHREIEKLKEQNRNLEKKQKTAMRRANWYWKRCKETRPQPSSPRTPRSKVNAILRQSNSSSPVYKKTQASLAIWPGLSRRNVSS